MIKKSYHQGRFIPKNPEKWINMSKGIPIVYRSGWERRFMLWCDEHPSIIRVGSESIAIPYVNPIKKTICRYFPDFYMEVKDKSGKILKYLVEVKPSKETSMPVKKGRKKSSTLLYESATYLINLSKWTSAKKWCDQNGIIFKIVTEKELF